MAIVEQSFEDWELIVIDDGSTDGTREFLQERLPRLSQPWRYIFQDNKGAFGARNRGIDEARGKYTAFYDSDDLWLPHHLADCVRVLEENLDIDWVYSATKIVDYESGKEISPNCFYVNGSPRPFLSRIYQRSEDLYVIPARDALKIALVDALYCGLQTSLIKSTFTSKHRLPPFAVGEDQVWSIRAAMKGFNFGCVSKVHVLYRQHSENISSSPGKSILKNISARLMLVSAFESLLTESILSKLELTVLRKRLRDDLFWGIGYQYQVLGMFAEAKEAYRRASKMFPLTWGQYKTFLFSLPRNLLSLRRTNLK
jgi:glycosyltransferase involved in cell wall biosynthesis